VNETIGAATPASFGIRRRTSSVTPLLQIANVSPGLVVTVLVVGLDSWFLGIAVGVFLLGTLGYWVSWRKRVFWINDENELEVASGVLFRRSRQLRISRLQSVDIVRPLIARLTGYSSLKVEVAGSGDSRVVLSFLSIKAAQALRSTILNLAKSDLAPTESAGLGPVTELRVDAESHSDSELEWQWKVPNGRLVASLALTTSTYFLIIGAVASVVFAVLDPFRGTGLLTLALAVGGSGISLINGVTSLFNFSIGRSESGIAISHGLFTTANYTVSPIRIQAIGLVQPIAWRPLGWFQLAINVAGTDQSSQKSGPRVLIPVIHEKDLPELFGELVPAWNLGVDRDWVTADQSSRWRFPWQSRRLAISVDPDLFMVRSGALTRRLGAVPHARIQSIRVTQGPWERRLGISSLHADSVPGPVRLSGRGLGSSATVGAALNELDLMASARDLTVSESW
jgi:putative membrane protein